ncbi:DoxX family protein [Teredinibacter turnerae]|uniref:DoxX family protein n=1 Tax=Teredinibacter turnerae TaxID=2426 RepID=UPI0003FB8A92|nr:DoxX family protein [Teredinibacter turnerae]
MNIFLLTDRYAKKLADVIPETVLQLAARVSIFMVFWFSAQTKLAGSEILGQKWMFWNLSSSTFALFEYDYAIPLLPPVIAAYLATISEFFFSLFILCGLLTRLSALALLIITLVIQIFVYPSSWPQHLLWGTALLYLLSAGAGVVSVDRLIGR